MRNPQDAICEADLYRLADEDPFIEPDDVDDDEDLDEDDEDLDGEDDDGTEVDLSGR